jgi:hypothetical protein
MVDNHDRAEWAGTALQAFSIECMDGRITEETVMDLICDIGHYMEINLNKSQHDVIDIYRIGLGAWKAESEDPDGEPWSNRVVEIHFAQ